MKTIPRVEYCTIYHCKTRTLICSVVTGNKTTKAQFVCHQVVRYGKYGHYHAHFDSETEQRTDKKCCHLHEDVVGAFLKGESCKLCRYESFQASKSSQTMAISHQVNYRKEIH